MIIPGRSKLVAPLVSGVLHAGLVGLIAGFGMGTVPPVLTPMTVELVQPDVLQAAHAAGSLREMPSVSERAVSPQAAPDPGQSADQGGAIPAPLVRIARPLPAAQPAGRAEKSATRPAPEEKRPALPQVVQQPAEPEVPLTLTALTGKGMQPVVGGGSSAAVAVAGNPRPAYPWLARQRHIEGRVLLRVRVEADGRPTGVEVVRSSGFALLDESARAALAHWTFLPARSEGVAVPAEVEVPIAFRLEDAESP